MERTHFYKARITWTGNTGAGTKNYASYSRDHTVSIQGKPDIHGSSDPAFRGDPGRYNPEELLLSSLSACHMLWYLHLCAAAGITVLDYFDEAEGIMRENSEVGGRFTEVILKPTVVIADREKRGQAEDLHFKANQLCFIARSVNFPVRHQPNILAADNRH